MGRKKNILLLTAAAFVLCVTMATLASADFIRLLSQMQPALYAYALTLCANRADAEDIVQEASAVMWKKLADFQPGTSFRSWAFSITYYEALAHRKRLSRKPALAAG
jgi:RNA polymerase sigma factor (sigma-70 family)